MKITYFNHIASILFGLLALYSATYALPNALSYTRDLGSDFLRLGFILFAVVTGLTLLLPHRLIPALRRIAAQTTPGPVRFTCALAMVICAFVAKLSGAVTLWMHLPVVVSFILVFVFPGFLYRDLCIISSEEISMRELGSTVGAEIRKGSRVGRYLFLCSIALVVLAILSFAFGKTLGLQTIPNPFWATLSAWVAALGGVAVTAVIIRPYFQLMPKRARYKSLPNLFLLAAALLIFSIVGNRALLLEALPTGAAYFQGAEAVQNFTVVKSRPNSRKKFCYGSVSIRTARGVQEICNFGPEFLRELSPGDTLAVVGKVTRLGLTIRELRFVD